MDPAQAQLMARYNAWMNERIYALLTRLDDAKRKMPRGAFFGSIHDTLAHIARSEAGYLHRIRTGQPLRRDASAPVPSIDDLLASIRESGQALVDVAPSVTAGDSVTIDWEGSPRAVPCVILLTQAINHATEHRSQVMATLTQIGIEPPSVDGWTYFAEKDK